MDLQIILWPLAVVLVGIGLAGIVLPVLPGATVLFLGLVCAAWAEDFAHVGAGGLTVLALMTVAAHVIDFMAGAFGAKRFGASRRAVAGAVFGAVAGVFFGLPGVLLGPFAGAVAGELSARPDLRAAGRAGVGATVGLALGVAAKMAMAVAMLSLFAFLRFF